jgi:hypothetical protein
MPSPRTGKPVANQFVINDDDGNTFFQSYNSIIVKKSFDGVFLDMQTWNYSRTTTKYRNLFLGEDTKTIVKKINCGLYKLVNLNT